VGSSLLVCVFLGCGFLVVGCRPTCCAFVCVCVCLFCCGFLTRFLLLNEMKCTSPVFSGKNPGGRDLLIYVFNYKCNVHLPSGNPFLPLDNVTYKCKSLVLLSC
jgi:hypothetical protein